MVRLFEFPEGATPLDDYSGLKLSWVQTMNDLNRVEAENISKAAGKYLRRSGEDLKWFTISELRTIHNTMFSDVWEWSGKFRQTTKSIGVKPYLISSQLAHLCTEVNSWSQNAVELTIVEEAARIHHQLVSIHPFENGNGRFSRLVADRYMSSWKCPYPIWPTGLDRNSKVRTAYIQSLREADAGNYQALIDLMIAFGAKDPALSELLGMAFYKARFSRLRLAALVKTLLRIGMNVNEFINNGHCPLNIALANGWEDIAILLIDHGADFKLRDKSGFDSFELAINRGLFTIAKKMRALGYPYLPGIAKSPKINYSQQYKFDLFLRN